MSANASVLDLSPYLIDMERQHKDVQYGDVGPIILRKANGKIVEMITQVKESVRFTNSDDALLYLVNAVRTLPEGKDATINFSIESKAGRVTRIETTTHHKVNYGGK